MVALGATGFAVWLAVTHGRQPALEFAAGYTVELSLSVDNLFVFMVLFQGFEIGPERQHKALLWGVGGAIVLRALFVAAGITLLRRFDWITWALGLFLLYAAARLARGRSAREVVPEWISPAAAGARLVAAGDSGGRVHRSALRHRLHSSGAGDYPQSSYRLHLEHRRGALPSVTLFRVGNNCSTAFAICITGWRRC